jgi:glycosyltransferase involved in cell wall biosynthesis
LYVIIAPYKVKKLNKEKKLPSKTILIIAFDSPPSIAVSTQRTMSFFNHLNELGWTTVLLSASENCYSSISTEQIPTLRPNQHLHRASAFNIKEKLSFKGKYLGPLATPDQYSPWILTAILHGRLLIKKHNIDIIFSTYPIPSANIIAGTLAKIYQIPWVADYRDPAPYIHTTNGKWLDMVHRKIDKFTLKYSNKIIFTTNESKKHYEKEYGISNDFRVIENGYNEVIFDKAYSLFKSSSPRNYKKYTIYYCGSLYNNGRSPDNLLYALAKLKSRNLINSENFQLILQGNLNSAVYATIIQRLHLNDIVQFKLPTSHVNCIINMLKSDMLLVIQGARFNIHIPAKMYECLKVNKPILLLAPDKSAVVNLANQFTQCKTSENINGIYEIISKGMLTKGKFPLLEKYNFEDYSRKSQAGNLHQLLLPLI